MHTLAFSVLAPPSYSNHASSLSQGDEYTKRRPQQDSTRSVSNECGIHASYTLTRVCSSYGLCSCCVRHQHEQLRHCLSSRIYVQLGIEIAAHHHRTLPGSPGFNSARLPSGQLCRHIAKVFNPQDAPAMRRFGMWWSFEVSTFVLRLIFLLRLRVPGVVGREPHVSEPLLYYCGIRTLLCHYPWMPGRLYMRAYLKNHRTRTLTCNRVCPSRVECFLEDTNQRCSCVAVEV
jgi:hypothetical protein